MKPHGATHIENDGTYWMQTSSNEWYWWRDGWVFFELENRNSF